MINRLLLVCDYNFRGESLVSNFFLQLSEQLRGKKVEISFILPISPSSFYVEKFKALGVKLIIVEGWRSKPADAHSRKSIFTISFAVLKQMRKYSIGTIAFHFSSPLLPVVTGIISQITFAKIPFTVFHQHNEVKDSKTSIPIPFLPKTARFKLGWTSHYVDKIAMVYKEGVNRLLKKGVPKGKTMYIHNGLKPPSKEPKRLHENETTTFLYAGRLIPGKGVDIVLNAFALLKKKGYKFMFLIAGVGTERKRLETLTSKLKLEKHTIFLGYKRDILDLYLKTDALLLPSQTEALPSVIIEAAFQKTPSIASKVGGIPELIIENETGILVHSENAEVWADKLEEVLSGETNLKNLGSASYNYVSENFTLDNMVDSYTKLYLER